MDPVGRLEFREFVTELRDEGRTILLATHDMVEAETLCDRVSFIDHGELVATESPRSLGLILSRFRRIELEGADEALLDSLESLAGVASVTRGHDGSARIDVADQEAVSTALRLIAERQIVSVKTTLPSLEEVYLHLIGERGLVV